MSVPLDIATDGMLGTYPIAMATDGFINIAVTSLIVGSGGMLVSRGLKKLHPDDRDLLDLIIIIDLSND